MAQIVIGKDGRCTCDYTDKCVCTSMSGEARRCTTKEIIDAGHRPYEMPDKENR